MVAMVYKNVKRTVRFFIYFFQTYLLESAHYRFSFWERAIYCFELLVPLKRVIKLESASTEFSLLSVEASTFLYPAAYSQKDLPWLYHEVFDPFVINPSSYGHTRLRNKTYDWVIDAGSCEGFYSLFAIKKYKPKNLMVIEPDLASIEACKQTLGQFHPMQKCIYVHGALGDKEGIGFLCKSGRSSDFFILENPAIEDGEVIAKVDLKTIDSLFGEHQVSGKILIKMDIENSEMKALLGATKSLEKYDITWCIAVYHNELNALECANIIKKHNSEAKIEFRGFYAYFNPPRPYILFSFDE